MTDQHDPLDDLLSAHLDGATSPADAARIAGDPALTARLAKLATVRIALSGDGPPIDNARREAAIAAALVAYDEGDAHEASAPVTDLAARRRGGRRGLQLAGIAAAVALLALAVPLLGRLDSGSNDDLAVRSPSSAAGSQLAPAESGADTLGGPERMTAAANPADLGAFATLPELTQAVREALAGQPLADAYVAESGAGASPNDGEGCSATDDDTGRVVYVVVAELDERPVVVIVRQDPDGGQTLVALDRDDCAKVAGGKL